MKSFNEWLTTREHWEEGDPDWWKDEDEKKKDKLRWQLKDRGVDPDKIPENIKNIRIVKKSDIDKSAELGYANADSWHKTPGSLPLERRKEIEEIWDYQHRILDIAQRTPREKLLDILRKINPHKDFSSRTATNYDLGVAIFTYFPETGANGGVEEYKRLMEFLKKELQGH